MTVTSRASCMRRACVNGGRQSIGKQYSVRMRRPRHPPRAPPQTGIIDPYFGRRELQADLYTPLVLPSPELRHSLFLGNLYTQRFTLQKLRCAGCLPMVFRRLQCFRFAGRCCGNIAERNFVDMTVTRLQWLSVPNSTCAALQARLE